MLRRLRRRSKKSANKVRRPTPVTRVYARVRSIAPKPPAPSNDPVDKPPPRLAPEPEPEPVESGNVVQLPTQPDAATRRIENKLDELLRARGPDYQPQAEKADWALLQKMRGIVQDPDSKPEARAKAGEIAKAMQWWLGSGQFGQHIDKPEGTLAVEVIMERYRDAHEIEQQEKEAR